MNREYRKAFTLIELAIVLVIIGLLTAGVVGGASLVESAKLQSIMSDTTKYKTAVKAFQLEYNALPGDMKDATLYWGKDATACNGDTGTAGTDGRQTCNGDNDKGFDYLIGIKPNEPWRAWQHLSNAKIIPGNYTGASITGCTNPNYCPSPNVNAPEAGIEGSTWNLFYLFDLNWAGKNQFRNILLLGNSKNLSADNRVGTWLGLVLTPKQMKSIDSKLDDGIANRGIITNMNAVTSVGGFNPNCTTLTGTVLNYNLSYTSIACNLLYDID